MNEETEERYPSVVAISVARWIVVVVVALFGIIHLIAIVHGIWFDDDKWILVEAKKQFAVVVGLPTAALTAIFLVSVFEVIRGPIEFEGLGFKFKGASGPIIMWVICFLSISGSMNLLWQ